MLCNREVIQFFELLQVAVGRRDSLSHPPSVNDWRLLYGMSVKQALVGVCYVGVERLPREMLADLPLDLKMQWFAMAERIKRHNIQVTSRVCELQRLLEADGWKVSVLKGQGIAEYYRFKCGEEESKDEASGTLKSAPFKLYRQSGDIDVWVDGRRDDIIHYMKAHYSCGTAVIHHIDVEVFGDVPVEVHFVPSYAYSWPRYRAYKHFFKEHKSEGFVPSGAGFCVPSVRFNLVYLLMHIFRHVFHEGVGLRQLMDYYFVLSAQDGDSGIGSTLKVLGLSRFAAAVMYVERQVFGLPKDLMICEPDEKAGRFLLEEIMRAGNFGQHDSRVRKAHSGNLVKLYVHNVCRLPGMIRQYPSEVLWAPFWKVGHYLWRKVKGY